MSRLHESLPPALTGIPVQLSFGVLLGLWLLVSWIPGDLLGVLMPIWLPSSLAFAAANTLRTSGLTWLGSGVYFGVAFVFFTYLEAVVLAGLFRFARRIYQAYRREYANAAA